MADIEEQGNLVRKLKADPAYGPTHDDTKAAIQKLKDLKLAAAPAKAPKETKPKVANPKGQSGASNQKDTAGQVIIGITAEKNVDFSDWYTQVLIKSEMLEYYDVSGCYILKPWSYSIWEKVTRWFDDSIKEMGVENASFPLFVSQKVLQKEKDHIEGFAPEVAWVTRAGKNELEEPIAIRPTSETVIYPYYAKWIRSHRDLPYRLNQWNSVVRWEFKTPQPFLRTREFLWQEGHTCFLTQKEAEAEVLEILDLYSKVYTDLLAVPMIKGIKTEKEKFAGGLWTSTIEGFIPTTGRGIQAATSHCLGQNFSKMFGIQVEDPEKPGEKLFVWQNSWGLSTRCIGVMTMVHGDDKGMVLPPRVAHTQVVVIACGVTAKSSEESRKLIFDGVADIVKTLRKAGVRVKADLRDTYTTGYKFADWEMKGVPVRIEFGPKDAEKKQVLTARRDTGAKDTLPLDGLETSIKNLLDQVQNDMYTKAKNEYDSHIIRVTEWADFVPALDKKNVILTPFCKQESCEDAIKDRSARVANGDEVVDERAPSMGAKSLCIPLEQPEDKETTRTRKCVQCGSQAEAWCLFGRSY